MKKYDETKQFLVNKREVIQKRLEDVQDYLDLSKQPILKKNKDGEYIPIGFRYGDRKKTKSDYLVRNKLELRNKLKRKIRRINKKLATL